MCKLIALATNQRHNVLTIRIILPSQWPSISQLKDLVRVQNLPEIVENFPSLQSSTFRVYIDQ